VWREKIPPHTLLKELKGIPVNRLEELYDYVHSLNPKAGHHGVMQHSDEPAVL
jgi:hypothetical protein